MISIKSLVLVLCLSFSCMSYGVLLDSFGVLKVSPYDTPEKIEEVFNKSYQEADIENKKKLKQAYDQIKKIDDRRYVTHQLLVNAMEGRKPALFADDTGLARKLDYLLMSSVARLGVNIIDSNATIEKEYARLARRVEKEQAIIILNEPTEEAKKKKKKAILAELNQARKILIAPWTINQYITDQEPAKQSEMQKHVLKGL